MINKLLSVIIPSRNDEFLQKTINDLLEKAEGEIEVIVILDGYWPDPILEDDPRVIILHQGLFHDSWGMRRAINDGVALSKGEYIMKIDEHCMVDEGFDKKLIEDYEEGSVVIPRRYRLDAENWSIIEDGRPPIDYMKMDYPYAKPHDKTQGLHGAEDRQRFKDRENILIDEVMTMQGSCYFMSRKHWDNVIKRMEDEDYGPFTQEAQEISNKTWMSGGRCLVNKKTWYAHLHKGARGKGYGFSTEQYKKHCELNEKGRLYCIDFWVNDRWAERKINFRDIINRFWPVPGWPEDWETRLHEDKKKDYSTLNYEGDFWLSNMKK